MKKRIKVCFLVSSLGSEGPVNVLYNIIWPMDPAEFDISLITFVPEKKISRLKEFEKLPIRIIHLRGEGSFKILNLYKKFKKAVLQESPDILHSHCVRSLFLMGMLPTKIKKSYTIQVYPDLQFKVIYGPIIGRLTIAFSKYFIRKVDLPIACAENVSDEFLKNDHFKVMAICNCGSFSPTKITKVAKQELRQKLGLNSELTYFIFVGRLSKEKNPLFLVNSFKNLKREKIGLIMLGEGILRETIEAIECPNIVMPGFVRNVNEYILAADYYVSPSLSEGLANTLLEAMAMGLPFLLSDIPPHYEVFNKTDRFMGLIFKNDNERDFKDKLEELLLYPYDEAAEAVRDCFTENFTPEQMSKKYQDCYHQLVNA